MDASIYSPIRITMPDGAPKIIRREQLPDARTIAIIPIRAVRDKTLSVAQWRMLCVCCSYANKAGLLWAGQTRLGKDLGISQQATSVTIKKLQAKGYIETVYNGFKGERAATRRIIFNEGKTMNEVLKVTEAKAPYMVEKEKKRGRPKKVRLSPEHQSNDNVDSVVLSQREGDSHKLVELKNKVSDKVWQLAMLRTDNSTDYATVKAAINKLLR